MNSHKTENSLRSQPFLKLADIQYFSFSFLYLLINPIFMKSNYKLLLFILPALVIFTSCGMIIKSYIRKDKENVPPDFGKEKTTLLVLNGRNAYTRKIEKIVKDNYHGDYIFVNKEELDS